MLLIRNFQINVVKFLPLKSTLIVPTRSFVINETRNLTHRRAEESDLKDLIQLYHDDKLGKTRETATLTSSDGVNPKYVKAFKRICKDLENNYLMVALMDKRIVGTCHLTILPSLTFEGSTRLQIEAVRVNSQYRDQRIGEWMVQQAIEYGRERDTKIIQLTTNKVRSSALRFYEKMGFSSTHE
eukprot:Pgem_evm1s1619